MGDQRCQLEKLKVAIVGAPAEKHTRPANKPNDRVEQLELQAIRKGNNMATTSSGVKALYTKRQLGTGVTMAKHMGKKKKSQRGGKGKGSRRG